MESGEWRIENGERRNLFFNTNFNQQIDKLTHRQINLLIIWLLGMGNRKRKMERNCTSYSNFNRQIDKSTNQLIDKSIC